MTNNHQLFTPIAQNDLGMKKDDTAAMMANLRAQGIETVVSISSKGSVEPPTPAVGSGAASTAAKADGSPRAVRRAPGGSSTLILG